MTPGRPEAFIWSKAPEETTRRGITMLIARISPIFSELSATPPEQSRVVVDEERAVEHQPVAGVGGLSDDRVVSEAIGGPGNS